MTVERWEKDYQNGDIVTAHIIYDGGEYFVETGDKAYDKAFKSYKGASDYLLRFGYAFKSVTIKL